MYKNLQLSEPVVRSRSNVGLLGESTHRPTSSQLRGSEYWFSVLYLDLYTPPSQKRNCTNLEIMVYPYILRRHGHLTNFNKFNLS